MYIPVNPDALSTEFQPLDPSTPKTVMVTKYELSPEQDKNGNDYFKAEFEVVEPEDDKGSKLFDSYIAVPRDFEPEMSAGQRRQVHNSNVKFARMLKCFKVTVGPDGFNSDDMIGKIGVVQIVNEDWQGRTLSKIKDYLF